MSNGPNLQPDLTEPIVFISNVDHILARNGYATGSLATKVIEISPRAVWYGHAIDILPGAPDPTFLEYAASFGRSPEVIVPDSIDPQRLSIRDGFEDPEVKKAVVGKWAESYIGDPVLHQLVTENGGQYGGGDPSDSVDYVNNKANFGTLAAGLVEPPPGVQAKGLDSIAAAVLSELQKRQRVFVRHVDSGGGFGNRAISVNSHIPSLAEIKAQLAGEHPEMWESGTALVEQYLDFASSPSIAFKTGKGFLYAAAQITHQQDYRGCWLPLPPDIWDPADLRQIGDTLAARASENGFWGRGGTDLGVGHLDDSGERMRVGFEINGRSVGTRHADAIGELFLGPRENWGDGRAVIKSVDHFELKGAMSAADVLDALGKVARLATLENPFGTVMTIPPAGNVVGIQFHGKTYRETEELYKHVAAEIGDPNPEANAEDHPLLEVAGVRYL